MASASSSTAAAGGTSAILSVKPLSMPFDTPDPFIFGVHHLDMYPVGDAKMRAPEKGDGMDFNNPRGYSHYHGTDGIPGFPHHPHYKLSTLTYVVEGTVDHGDSYRNGGRYGSGDLQWLCSGKGIQHSETFPLVHTDKPNTLNLFQIWLNTPAKFKGAPPSYKMHWAESVVSFNGSGGAACRVVIGKLGDVDSGCTPPEHSWATDPANEVGLFYLTLPAGGSKIEIPPAVHGKQINRAAYIVQGKGVKVAEQRLPGKAAVFLSADKPVVFQNGHAADDAQILILQGRPIAEPLVQRGSFVAASEQELREAFAEYRRTEFGGWPWPRDDLVFPREKGRFASFVGADGSMKEEYPPQAAGGAKEGASAAADADAATSAGAAAGAGGGKSEL